MLRSQMLDQLSEFIAGKKAQKPLLVAIDGIDGAGKSKLSKELVFPLRKYGYNIVQVSTDNFHNTRLIRYRRGKESAEGYYYDSFNTSAIIDNVLRPLTEGGSRQIRRSIFDFKTDLSTDAPLEKVEENSIILFEGVFLMRPEFVDYWDVTIFVDITFEVALERAYKRNLGFTGSLQEIDHLYERRYFAGQRIYLERCHPYQRADVMIDNNDVHNPILYIQPSIV